MTQTGPSSTGTLWARFRFSVIAALRNTIFVAHWRRAKLASRNDLQPIQILAILLFLRTSLLGSIFW
jgi:hypothetical protein